MASDAIFVEMDLFVSGEQGYHTYRIPTMVRTPEGVLLAFCEGRKHGIGDAGTIDLLMRRSMDGGETWEPMRVLFSEDPSAQVTCGNPAPVVDQTSGRICLLFCRNNRQAFVAHSQDAGTTWTERREITESLRSSAFDWKRIATGPVNGIQLASGRLAVPVWLNDEIGGEYHTAVVLSGDGGESWRVGGIVPAAVKDCNESAIAEPEPGLLVMSSRNNGPAKRRATAFSRDGGETWDEPALDPALPTAPCQGSLIAASSPSLPAPLLLTIPSWTEPAAEKPGRIQRKRLTVWQSKDSGRTWPHARILQPGRAEYSNLVEVGPGQFGCLYERGAEKLYHVAALTFARFDSEWLQGQNDAPDIRLNT